MSDAKCPESGHLMLISPERVFYAGLLGRPRQRTIGGFAIYTALQGQLRLMVDSEPDRVGAIAIVPPYLAHSMACDDLSISCLVIEPETVAPAALKALANRISGEGGAAIAGRIRHAYQDLLRTQRCDGFTTSEFDTIFFGEPLPPRPIDRRIARAIARLHDFSGSAETAASCAAAANLSPSRFLHLFKDDTGVSFRAFRAWKRARHLLYFVNEDINLAHLAQDIGYPDSTHFSHSIRRFYGLRPRVIFSGSRDLLIYRGDAGTERADLRQGRA